MIYPSYGVTINTEKEFVGLYEILSALNIKRQNIDEWPKTYYVDGEIQTCTAVRKDIPVVSYDEFFKIYDDFYEKLHSFIDNLQVGDKVVIEKRRGNCNLYPCSFTDAMTEFTGKEMTIASIVNVGYVGYPFSNYSNKCFHMKEDKGEFTWHSSMFEMTPQVPIKILNLSDISINPLIIQ